MNIHEYQAKELMGQLGLEVLPGGMAESPEAARKVAEKLGGQFWVVKAQIHAGGRGKAGGVKLAKSLEQVSACARELLGKVLVTHQTGSQGKEVLKVLVEQGCEIAHEYYVGVVLDRSRGMVLMMACAEGGVDIEQVAQKSPAKIVKAHIDPAAGFTPFVGRKLAYALGLQDKDEIRGAMKFFKGLYDLYMQYDCSTVEINPLVKTREGKFVALDAKLVFDDNALFRHPELVDLCDPTEESVEELQAKKHGLSYVSLGGNIGCLVNGAGLAMATMDIIALHGGKPANFLDVGGSASKEAVEKAFSIILSDQKVCAILVNIFGGIMKCDIIAEGVVAAARQLQLQVPLVVRLEGTNGPVGKKILTESGLDIISVDNLHDAADEVVKAVGAS